VVIADTLTQFYDLEQLVRLLIAMGHSQPQQRTSVLRRWIICINPQEAKNLKFTEVTSYKMLIEAGNVPTLEVKFGYIDKTVSNSEQNELNHLGILQIQSLNEKLTGSISRLTENFKASVT
jgi:hypothetical protein